MEKPAYHAVGPIPRVLLKSLLVLLFISTVRADDATSWMNNGDKYLSAGQYDKAIECYDAAVQLDPANASAWQRKGVAEERSGHSKEALQYYQKAIECDPKCVLAYRGCARIFAGLARMEDAKTSSDRAAEIAGEWVDQAYKAFQADQFEEAISYSNLLLAQHEQESWAWGVGGASLTQLGKDEDALVCCDRSLEIAIDYRVLCNRGVCLYRLRRYDEALVSLDSALELQPACLDALQVKVMVLQALGRPEEELAVQRQLDKIRLSQRRAEAEGFYNEGLRQLGAKAYEKAVGSFDAAIECDPQDPEHWNAKGCALFDGGNVAEALPCFDRALELDPKFLIAYRSRGRSLESLGRHGEALAANTNADRIAHEWMADATNALNTGDAERSMTSSSMLINHCEKEAWAWNARAIALERLGRNDEALAAYDKSLSHTPDPAVLGNKARLFSGLHRYAEALDCYNEALKLDSSKETILLEKLEVLKALNRRLDCAFLQGKIFTRRFSAWMAVVALIMIAAGGLSKALGLLRGRNFPWSKIIFASTGLLGAHFRGKIATFTTGIGVVLFILSVTLWGLSRGYSWFLCLPIGWAFIVFLRVASSGEGDAWYLWWQTFPARRALRWGSSWQRLDAARRLQYTSVRADVYALVRALRDPEVSDTADAILRTLSPAHLDLLEKRLRHERDETIKFLLASAVDHIKNKVQLRQAHAQGVPEAPSSNERKPEAG